MNIKSKKFIIFIVIVISVLAYIFLNNRSDPLLDSFKRFSRTEKLMNIDQFLSKVEQHEIVLTEIYYMPFSIYSNSPRTENRLLSIVPKVKVLNYYRLSYTQAIADTLKEHQLKKTENTPFDFSYSCLMYSNSDEVIRFSISKMGIDKLYINGQPYKVPFETIDAFLRLLPAVDYELAMKEIEVFKNTAEPLKDN